jgi:hypothetical protein
MIKSNRFLGYSRYICITPIITIKDDNILTIIFSTDIANCTTLDIPGSSAQLDHIDES